MGSCSELKYREATLAKIHSNEAERWFWARKRHSLASAIQDEVGDEKQNIKDKRSS